MRHRLAVSSLVVVLAAGVPVLAAGGGGGSIIEPELGTIFWTVVTFILLAWLLRRVAWKPLLGALEEREKSIERTLDQARSDHEAAEKLLTEHKSLVAQARRERAEAVEQGRQEAETLRAEILDEARGQREQLLEQAAQQTEAAIRRARDELRALTADLAIQAAQKLLEKNLDEATHRKLVEEYLADVERSSAGPTALRSS